MSKLIYLIVTLSPGLQISTKSSSKITVQDFGSAPLISDSNFS